MANFLCFGFSQPYPVVSLFTSPRRAALTPARGRGSYCSAVRPLINSWLQQPVFKKPQLLRKEANGRLKSSTVTFLCLKWESLSLAEGGNCFQFSFQASFSTCFVCRAARAHADTFVLKQPHEGRRSISREYESNKSEKKSETFLTVNFETQETLGDLKPVGNIALQSCSDLELHFIIHNYREKSIGLLQKHLLYWFPSFGN